MHPRHFALLGIVFGVLLALLLFAPARWLGSAIAEVSHGRVQLQNARGSLWNGEADVLLSAGRGSREQRIFGHSAPCPFVVRTPGNPSLNCQRLHWQLRVRWLGLDLTLGQPCCLAEGARLALRLHTLRRVSVEMQHWQLRLGAEFLSGLGAPWNTLEPQGETELAAQQFRIEREGAALRFAGSARITLREVTSRLASLKPLGSYELLLEPIADAPGALGLQLSSNTQAAGALRLFGRGRWSAAEGLRFEGSAEPARAEDEAALSNLLSIMGRREGKTTRLML